MGSIVSIKGAEAMANKAQVNLKYHKGYGENFKFLRESHQIDGKPCTVRQLEEKFSKSGIGISYSTISDIENERREPTVEQAQIYHDYFDVPFDYLTGELKIRTKELVDIGRKTGLSEKSINKILKYNSENNITWGMDLINSFIESDNFETLFFYLSQYATHNNQHIDYSYYSINTKDIAFVKIQDTIGEISKELCSIFEKTIKETGDTRVFYSMLEDNFKKNKITEAEYLIIIDEFKKGNFDCLIDDDFLIELKQKVKEKSEGKNSDG